MDFNSAGVVNDSPETNLPAGSMAKFPSLSRHWPMPSKFSNPNPMGSMRAWQEAQRGFERCCSILCRSEPERTASLASLNSGTSGGGGGGGEPRIFSRIHLPLFTGEVRVGLEVMVRMLAWVRMPPRFLDFKETRLKSFPATSGMA